MQSLHWLFSCVNELLLGCWWRTSPPSTEKGLSQSLLCISRVIWRSAYNEFIIGSLELFLLTNAFRNSRQIPMFEWIWMCLFCLEIRIMQEMSSSILPGRKSVCCECEWVVDKSAAPPGLTGHDGHCSTQLSSC